MEEIEMEEIKLKNNSLGIKVYVIGKPDIEHMPKEEHDLFIKTMTSIVLENLEKLQGIK